MLFDANEEPKTIEIALRCPRCAHHQTQTLTGVAAMRRRALAEAQCRECFYVGLVTRWPEAMVVVTERDRASRFVDCFVDALLEDPVTGLGVIRDANTNTILAYVAPDRFAWVCTPIGRRRVKGEVLGSEARSAA